MRHLAPHSLAASLTACCTAPLITPKWTSSAPSKSGVVVAAPGSGVRTCWGEVFVRPAYFRSLCVHRVRRLSAARLALQQTVPQLPRKSKFFNGAKASSIKTKVAHPWRQMVRRVFYTSVVVVVARCRKTRNCEIRGNERVTSEAPSRWAWFPWPARPLWAKSSTTRCVPIVAFLASESVGNIALG